MVLLHWLNSNYCIHAGTILNIPHFLSFRPNIYIEQKALDTIAHLCDGDARTGLNSLQLAVQAQMKSMHPNLLTQERSSREIVVTEQHIKEGLQRSHILYDKAGKLNAFVSITGGAQPKLFSKQAIKSGGLTENSDFYRIRFCLFFMFFYCSLLSSFFAACGNACVFHTKARSITTVSQRCINPWGVPTRVRLSTGWAACWRAAKIRSMWLADWSALPVRM